MKQLATLTQEFTKGIVKENPILRLILGTCPTLAVTTTAFFGFGMGVSALAVLLGSNIVIAALRKIIPDKVRIPAYIIVIATFVTIVDMVLKAFVPALYAALGIFIPLIVVNCIILGRAEAFARKNGVLPSIFDALGMGVGYCLALTIMGSFREIIGAGTFFGHSVFGAGFQPMLLFASPPGAFITLGCFLALVNYLCKRFGIE